MQKEQKVHGANFVELYRLEGFVKSVRGICTSAKCMASHVQMNDFMKKNIHEHYTVPKHASLPPICIGVEWLQHALINHKRAVVQAAAKANGDLIRQVVDQVRVRVNVNRNAHV